jgi:hypothetical protein
MTNAPRDHPLSGESGKVFDKTPHRRITLENRRSDFAAGCKDWLTNGSSTPSNTEALWKPELEAWNSRFGSEDRIHVDHCQSIAKWIRESINAINYVSNVHFSHSHWLQSFQFSSSEYRSGTSTRMQLLHEQFISTRSASRRISTEKRANQSLIIDDWSVSTFHDISRIIFSISHDDSNKLVYIRQGYIHARADETIWK